MLKTIALLKFLNCLIPLKEFFSLGNMANGENFYHVRPFKSPRINFSVQRPDIYLEANNMTFYAVLLHFAKLRDLKVKVFCDCPI